MSDFLYTKQDLNSLHSANETSFLSLRERLSEVSNDVDSQK